MLRYDWHHNLELEVAPELSVSLCGLCGNYNHNATNDFATPDGTVAAVDFALRWKVDTDGALCTEECSASCPVCSTGQVNSKPALGSVSGCCRATAMLILTRTSAAARLTSVLPMELLLLFRSMQAYSDICQRLGLRVFQGRLPRSARLATCSVAATVSHTAGVTADISVSTTSPRRCSGWTASVGSSAPASLPPRTSPVSKPSVRRTRCAIFWLGYHKEELRVCTAQRDRHCTTFDGNRYDFQGTCAYQLVRHFPSSGDLPGFSVATQNKRGPTPTHGYSIEISHYWDEVVVVNGIILSLPSVLSQGKVKIYMIGLSKCIETDFGVPVTYNRDLLTVQVPRVFSGSLCGNFNTGPEDYLTDNGDINARSWRQLMIEK
ncbi:IgGFc-binding protein-like [Salvelinus alpinus]